jgi:predicted nucleotidyltransferase
MIDLLSHHQDEIAVACRSYGIRRLEVVGSAARGDFQPGRSDVDFIAYFEEAQINGSLFSRYMDFTERLEHILGTHVDVLTPHSIRNPHLKSSLYQDKQCIYDA